MKKAAASLVLWALCGSAWGAPAAEPRIDPGLWHIKTVITNNGVAEPPLEEDICATAEELRDLERYFALSAGDLPARCSSSRVASAPGSLAFRMKCTGKDFTTDVRATITFPSTERYEVRARADARQHGKAIVAITRADARRVGPCPQ